MKNEDFIHSRFGEFKDYIYTSWKKFYNEDTFCDVSLAYGDKIIKTHKIVISSFSSVLGNILKHNSEIHPVIYLRGVSNSELEYLVDFMYKGEVNIAREDLNNFIAVAQDLKIKGLQVENEEDAEKHIENYEKLKVPMKNESSELEAVNDVFFNKTKDSIKNFLSKNNTNKNEKVLNSNFKKIVTDHGKKVIIEDNVQEVGNYELTKLRTKLNENEKWNERVSEDNIETKIESVEEKVLFNDNNLLSQKCEENKINDIHTIIPLPQKQETNYKISKVADHVIIKNMNDSISTFNLNSSTKHLDEQTSKPIVKKVTKSTDENSTSQIAKRSSAKYPMPTTKTKKGSINWRSCKKCDKQFKSAGATRSLKRHYESVHEGIRYACDECDYKARENSKLKIHIEKLHRGVRHHCTECDFISRDKTYLKWHIDSLHEGKRYPCKKCNYQSLSRRMLLNHIRKNCYSRSCDLCDKTFNKETSKNMHMLKVHKQC